MTDERLLPVPDELSTPYWEGTARHELVLARCSQCDRRSHPPDVVCSHCQHPEPTFLFEPVEGSGTIRSWITVRQSFLPGFEEIPFVLVDVALDADEDIRLIGRLIDGPDTTLAIGDRVRLVFEDLSPDVAVPAFEVARP